MQEAEAGGCCKHARGDRLGVKPKPLRMGRGTVKPKPFEVGRGLPGGSHPATIPLPGSCPPPYWRALHPLQRKKKTK